MHRHAHLCEHAESKHSTVMSSVTPQQSDGDHLQPHEVMSAHDHIIGRLAYLPDGRRVVTVVPELWGYGIWRFGDLGARMDVDGAREGAFGLAVTQDGTKIIISDDDGNITVWSVETTKLSKNGLTQRAGQKLSSRGWSTHCGWCLGGVHLHHGRATGQPFPRGPIRPQRGVPTERKSHAALMTTSACMTSALAHSSSERCVLWSRDRSKPFSGSGFIIGTPIQENKSDMVEFR